MGVAIINYTQVWKWVWQLAGLAPSLHHFSLSEGPFGKLEAGKWLIGLRKNYSVVNIYSHDDDDDQSIVACLRVSASALRYGLNFH